MVDLDSFEPNTTKTFIANEPWYKKTWRPLMAFLYAAICAFDFIIAPAFMIASPIITKTPYVAWVPLTLQNGGLIHLSFGSIIGIYAWGRSREKLEGVSMPPEEVPTHHAD